MRSRALREEIHSDLQRMSHGRSNPRIRPVAAGAAEAMHLVEEGPADVFICERSGREDLQQSISELRLAWASKNIILCRIGWHRA